jgi:hypothetical protein
VLLCELCNLSSVHLLHNSVLSATNTRDQIQRSQRLVVESKHVHKLMQDAVDLTANRERVVWLWQCDVRAEVDPTAKRPACAWIELTGLSVRDRCFA